MFNPMEAGKLLAKEIQELKERNARNDAQEAAFRAEILNLLGEIRNYLNCSHNGNCSSGRCKI